MYTEDYDKKDFPYRNFFIKLIIIMSILLLVVWIFSKVFAEPSKNKNSFTDDFFYKELEKMKVAALNYYTEDKLPKNKEDSNKVLLKDLIKNKNIKEIKNNGNVCNNKKSYIMITKKDNEYLLKVYLHCGDENDYSIMHLNHYPYCTNTYLCEEQDNDEEVIEEVKDENTYTNNYSNNYSNTSPKKKTTKTNSSKNKTTNSSNKQTNNKGTISISGASADDKYLYEYKKTTNAVFSNWSLWNDWQKVDCFTNVTKCEENDTSCLKEVKRYDRKEKITTYIKSYNNIKSELFNEAAQTRNICSLYDYVEIDKEIYRLPNGDMGKYTKINNINSNTKNTIENWVYNGRASYVNPPSDTYNTHYILVGPDYSECGNTCTNNPKYIFDKYTYKGSITKITTADTCNNMNNKTIPIYTRKQKSIHFERTENLYGTVCYKSERTRSLINKGTTSTKWSNYNDTKLLNSGYKYTGNKKNK